MKNHLVPRWISVFFFTGSRVQLSQMDLQARSLFPGMNQLAQKFIGAT